MSDWSRVQVQYEACSTHLISKTLQFPPPARTLNSRCGTIQNKILKILFPSHKQKMESETAIKWGKITSVLWIYLSFLPPVSQRCIIPAKSLCNQMEAKTSRLEKGTVYCMSKNPCPHFSITRRYIKIDKTSCIYSNMIHSKYIV